MVSLKKLKQIQWFKEKERDFDLFLESFYIEGTKQKYAKRMGTTAHSNHRMDFSDGSVFMDRKEIEDSKEIFLKQGKRLAAYAGRLTNNYLRFSQRFVLVQKRYSNFEYRNLTNKKLATLYHQYIEAIHDLIPYSYVISNILDETAHDLLVNALRRTLSNPENTYLQLTRPARPNMTSLEHLDRLKLAAKYQKVKSFVGLKATIEGHVTKYGWLACYRPTDLPLSEKELKRAVQELAKDKQLRSKIAQIRKQQASGIRPSIGKIGLPPHLGKLVKIMQQHSFLRTERREIVNRGFFVLQPLHHEIAKRMGIKFSDLSYGTTWELLRFLKTGQGITLGEIQQRKEQFCVTKINNAITIVSGKTVEHFKKLIPKAQSETAIRGIPVYAGVVTGTVQIVKTRNDIAGFTKGSILVAPTVATWMVSIIDKCSGIITDFGGSLSHTAILSREFKKPCLIGTRNATSVLRNGMTIVLNAHKGTANRL